MMASAPLTTQLADTNVATDSSPAGFPAEAECQESRIDELLTVGQQDLRAAIWSDDITDPEFKKNLCIFHSLIAGAAGLYARQKMPEPQVDELTRRIRLPSDKPLTLPLLLTHRFELEQVLAELGDETYIRTRAAALYAEPPGSSATWDTLFKVRPPLVVDGKPAGQPASAEAVDGQPSSEKALESTRAMVASLLAAKQAVDLPLRARRELKEQVMRSYVLPAVFTAAIIFALAILLTDMLPLHTLAVSATAAVAGAVLGRLKNLRDEVTRGSQVREFLSLFVAQVAVGLITGLFVSVAADQLSFLNISTRNGLATLCFVAGFSEAAFLGLVSKIAGAVDVKAQRTTDRS